MCQPSLPLLRSCVATKLYCYVLRTSKWDCTGRSNDVLITSNFATIEVHVCGCAIHRSIGFRMDARWRHEHADETMRIADRGGGSSVSPPSSLQLLCAVLLCCAAAVCLSCCALWTRQLSFSRLVRQHTSELWDCETEHIYVYPYHLSEETHKLNPSEYQTRGEDTKGNIIMCN